MGHPDIKKREILATHFQLGNLYLSKEAYANAIQEFQFMLQVEPLCKEAHTNLGVAYLRLGDTLEAIRSFSNVLRIDETHEEARHNLAAVLLQEGRYREASRQYEEILRFRPCDLDAQYNLGVALMPQGRLEEAKVCFEAVLQKQPDYCDAHINLAAALMKLDKREDALDHYQTVLKLQPEHAFAGYMVQALTGQGLPSAAPAEYVQYLFNNYASFFDDHVQQVLHYETPMKLYEIWMASRVTAGRPYQLRILDLGCGTGLSGSVFREVASELIGIDVSSKMLDIARSKNIYDDLWEGDINTIQIGEQFDVVVAADVFVYVGDLENIFRKVRTVLNPGGSFLFSTEISTGEGYTLQKTARYAHSAAYIAELATQTGFSIVDMRKTVLRQQDNQPLEGILYILSVMPAEAGIQSKKHFIF